MVARRFRYKAAPTINYIFQHHLNAQNGFNGRTKKMHGADGEDYIVQVPLLLKTVKGEVIGDLVEIGQRVIVAHGGKGGETRFTTKPPTTPSSVKVAKNSPSQSNSVLADVGLVGFPSSERALRCHLGQK